MSRTSGGDDLQCGDSRQRTDSVFEALSSASRRRVLFELLEEGRVRIGEFARRDGAAAGVESQRVRLRLIHVDLPKLSEGGFVRWDPGETVVRPGRRFRDLEPLLRVVRDGRYSSVE